MSTATATSIEAQVAEVTGLSQKENEPRMKWLARLVKSADTKLNDEEWAELSTEAQNWVNSSMKAMNNSQPVIDPTADDVAQVNDADDDDADDDDASGADEDSVETATEARTKSPGDEKKKTRVSGKNRAPQAKPKADKEARTRERKHTDAGASDAWRSLCLANPEENVEALGKRFKHNLPEGARALLLREMRHALRLLGEAGRLKKA